MSAEVTRRIALVTQWFPPEPADVPLWIAQALRDRGLAIGVVTGVPHYPAGVAAAGYRATHRTVETVMGFRTLRVPEYPSHDRSAARRIATFGSFALSGAALASREIGAGDVTLVYSSPATAALPAMVAKARYGTPYVLYVQDLWPDSIFATGFLNRDGVKRLVEPSVNAFVKASYRAASHVCVITPGMRRLLMDRGVPAEKVSVVHNWVDEEVLHPRPPDGRLRRLVDLGEGEFIALYAGNAGEAQGLDSWVQALALLSHSPRPHLAFLGGGTQREALIAEAAARGVDAQVHFLDAVPAAEVPAFVADADVSIVSLADRALFEITMPSKLQAALAMASPVLASCRGDVADVVTESQAGWVATPEHPAAIADVVRTAMLAGPDERERRGRLGRAYYEAHMAEEIGAQRLAEILRTAASSRGSKQRRSRRSG